MAGTGEWRHLPGVDHDPNRSTAPYLEQKMSPSLAEGNLRMSFQGVDSYDGPCHREYLRPQRAFVRPVALRDTI